MDLNSEKRRIMSRERNLVKLSHLSIWIVSKLKKVGISFKTINPTFRSIRGRPRHRRHHDDRAARSRKSAQSSVCGSRHRLGALRAQKFLRHCHGRGARCQRPPAHVRYRSYREKRESEYARRVNYRHTAGSG